MKKSAKRGAASGPVRYAIYLRCSTDDQKEGDYTTIDTQREINAAHVAKLGGTLVGEYNDEGRSGSKLLNRPDWNRLLADAQAGKFDAVCITYMSRLGRGNAFINAEYELEKCGVTVEMVQEKFTDDLAGYLNKQMRVLFDGVFPQVIREHTKTKMEQMVSKGYVTGNYNALGYRKEFVAGADVRSDKRAPQRLAVDLETALIAVRAFTLFAETHGIAAVRDYLQTATDRHWSYESTRLLLTNEIYRGVLKFGDWVNEKAHEAIITQELWDQVQQALQNRTRAPKRNPKDKTHYYLRGRVLCKGCDCHMTPGDHHGNTAVVRYYECTAAHRFKSKTCPTRRVNAHTLHEVIVSEIRRAVEHPTRLAHLIREAVKQLPAADTLKSEAAALTRRERDIDRKIKNVVSAIEAGGSEIAPLLLRLDELETQRKRLATEQEALEQKVAASRSNRPSLEAIQRLWGRFGELWEQATEDQREELMPLLVERVEMETRERGESRRS